MDQSQHAAIKAFGVLQSIRGQLEFLDSMLEPLQEAGRTDFPLYGPWLGNARKLSRSLKKSVGEYRSRERERGLFTM